MDNGNWDEIIENSNWAEIIENHLKELEAKQWGNLKDKNKFLYTLENYLKENGQLTTDDYTGDEELPFGNWGDYLDSLFNECITYLQKYNIPNLEADNMEFVEYSFGLIVNGIRYECERICGQGTVDLIRINPNTTKYDIDYNKLEKFEEPECYKEILEELIEGKFNLKELGYEIKVTKRK